MSVEESDTVPCGRCKTPVLKRVAEIYWFCSGYLCADCWDKYGHCGHAEAEKFDQQQKRRE